MSATNFRGSFGFRIFKAFGLTIIAVAVVLSTVLVVVQRRAVQDSLMREGRMLAVLLSGNARTGVFSENGDIVKNEVQGFMNQQHVVAVFVYNGDYRLIYSDQKKPFAGKSAIEGLRVQLIDPRAGGDGVVVVEGRDAYSFVSPVVLDMTPSAEESFYIDRPPRQTRSLIGFVEILLDAAGPRKEMGIIVIRNTAMAAAFIVFGSLAIYLVLRRAMEPLSRLTGAVRALGRGETVEKIPVESRDEIGRLAEDFNSMYDDLRKRQEEKNQLEQRLHHAQRMEAVGTLARGIAHDFNNILATIKGSLFIIQKQIPQTGALEQYGEKILTQIAKAHSLVQGLFAFSKNQSVNLQQVDLNAVCRKACPLISAVIGSKVDFQFHPCDGALEVKADVFQLEQVLINLSTNARDAMPDGGTLLLRTSRVLQGRALLGEAPGHDRGYALLSFADTGIGMDEETRGRIFEPFYSTKEPGRGTGLGLSIVYGIIQQHEGYIEVRSTRGVETVFDIYLPLIEAAPDVAPAGDEAG